MKLLRILPFIFFINSSLFSQNQNENQQIFIKNIEVLVKFEEKHKVQFFYNENWFKECELSNIKLSDNIENDLSKILRGCKLYYHLLQDSNIIITKFEKIDKTYDRASNLDIEYISETTISDLNSLLKAERKIHTIGIPGSNSKVVTLSGIIKEYSTEQKLQNVAIIADNGLLGTTSDENGHYKLHLPQGYHSIVYQHLGYKPTIRKIEIFSNGRIDIPLVIHSNLFEEVSIITDYKNDKNKQTGYEYLQMAKIKEIPSFMGEPDVIKYSLLLPGIQSAGEADMSFNVRGGKGDQNLILLDGMHSYSFSHFFGFFPGINPESISNSRIYKSGIPIEYGSKISSVYDISIKPGSLKKLNINGGISPVSINGIIDFPLLKNKISISISGRSTYSNWLFEQIDVQELEQSSANFYDIQAKLKYYYNNNSFLSLYVYKSNDQFSFHKDTNYTFNNQLASLNWSWFINETYKLNVIGGYTEYLNKKIEKPSPEYASLKEHGIKDFKLNANIVANIGNHTITSGLEAIYHEVNPWSLSKENVLSEITPIFLKKDKAIEAAIFAGEKLSLLNNKLSINMGLRYSMFSSIGPKKSFVYDNDIVISDNIIDTISYPKNKLIGSNSGFEIRLVANYKIKNNQNLNFSFDRNRQYIHVLNNTQTASPNDSWQLSNEYISPQIGNQLSLGYNVSVKSSKYSGSIEMYYKKIENIKDFINGSNFDFNPHPETEIINAKGKSYGLELLLKKNNGLISGWVSYTYSRSFLKSSTDYLEKMINKGEYYPASYDKPHNLSAILNLEPSRRIVISSVFNYSSGVPVTLPVAKIEINGSYPIIYSERNEYRLPYYLRWDLSITYRGSLKREKLISSSFMLSVYNVTGRMNAYSVYYKNNNGNIQGYKLSIFGSPIPTLTYKFSF